MTKCEENCDLPKRGRGTGEGGLLYSARNKYGEGGREYLIGEGEEMGGLPVPRPFFAGHLPFGLMPYEVWPSRKAYIRYMATSRPAISMRVELRREAAADPGLEWDAQHYRYRIKRNCAPHPQERASGGP